MNTSYRKWQALVEVRPVYDYDSHGVRFDTGEREEVVVMFLPDGTRYEVTVDDESGDARITSLLVRPAPGGEADHAAPRQIPPDLGGRGCRTPRRVPRSSRGGPTRFAAAIEASGRGGGAPASWVEARPPGLRCPMEGHLIPHPDRGRAGAGEGPALAEHYGVKEATIDA